MGDFGMSYEQQRKKAAAERIAKMERTEAIEKAAQPFFEAGQPFEDFARKYAVSEDDRQIYDELKREYDHQQELNAAFLEGFTKG